MELWIRSQDKMKLVNNCKLYISNEIRNEYVIEDVNNKYLKLGTYKSKERALEVLDEIQNIIKNGGVETEKFDEAAVCYYVEKENVYEMPKE